MVIFFIAPSDVRPDEEAESMCTADEMRDNNGKGFILDYAHYKPLDSDFPSK